MVSGCDSKDCPKDRALLTGGKFQEASWAAGFAPGSCFCATCLLCSWHWQVLHFCHFCWLCGARSMHPKKMQQLPKSLHSQLNLFLTFWISWGININIIICSSGYSEGGRGTTWTSCALFHFTKRKTSLEDSCYFIHFTTNTTRLSRSHLVLSKKRIQRSAEMNTIGKNRVA